MATKVIRSADCGNSPKNKFAEEFVIALLTGNSSKLSKWIDEGIEWQRACDESVHGKEGFLETVRRLSKKVPSQVTIQSVVTHGKVGAVNGLAKFGRQGNTPFCYFIEFASASAKAVNKIAYYECPQVK